ncbi:MAG: hypothetical protein PF961_01835 [Planctomycetota bacterium]|jgi:hypothetical protein|nr:hypothetical protein [Planctomycetota bacterium]
MASETDNWRWIGLPLLGIPLGIALAAFVPAPPAPSPTAPNTQTPIPADADPLPALLADLRRERDRLAASAQALAQQQERVLSENSTAGLGRGQRLARKMILHSHVGHGLDFGLFIEPATLARRNITSISDPRSDTDTTEAKPWLLKKRIDTGAPARSCASLGDDATVLVDGGQQLVLVDLPHSVVRARIPLHSPLRSWASSEAGARLALVLNDDSLAVYRSADGLLLGRSAAQAPLALGWDASRHQWLVITTAGIEYRSHDQLLTLSTEPFDDQANAAALAGGAASWRSATGLWHQRGTQRSQVCTATEHPSAPQLSPDGSALWWCAGDSIHWWSERGERGEIPGTAAAWWGHALLIQANNQASVVDLSGSVHSRLRQRPMPVLDQRAELLIQGNGPREPLRANTPTLLWQPHPPRLLGAVHSAQAASRDACLIGDNLVTLHADDRLWVWQVQP